MTIRLESSAPSRRRGVLGTPWRCIDLSWPAAAAAVFLMAAVSPVSSAQVPPAGSGSGVVVPTVDSFVLSNGVHVLRVYRRRPFVSAAWAVRSGSASERPGKTGVAHLLEHLLYNSSETLGTRDFAAEAKLLQRREELEDRRRTKGNGNRAAVETMEREIAAVDGRLRELWRKGEATYLYTRAGAVGLEAVTEREFSLFAADLPPEQLELWFWIESDRLLHPVIRDFYAEVTVVGEERRQRVETRPAGLALERFEETFWGASGAGFGYSWSTGGRPDDLAALRPADLYAHLAEHLCGGNLSIALVGPIRHEEARELAQRYFGRLPADRGPQPSRPVAPQHAVPKGGPNSSGAVRGAEFEESSHPANERRFVEARLVVAVPPAAAGTDGVAGSAAEQALVVREPLVREQCACRPRVELRWRTVPFAHDDAPTLDLLAGVLNGRTGRLHRGVALEDHGAFSAYAEHLALRAAGSFSLIAEARENEVLDDLVKRLRLEADRLREDRVGDVELDRARNQMLTENATEWRSSRGVVSRLLAYDALGDWRRLAKWPAMIETKSGEDLRRVARRYLSGEPAVLILQQESL